MKIQIIYSSLTKKTERLARYLYDGLEAEEKSIHNLADGIPELDGDILLIGYWVDKGGPNAQMKAFMETVEGKKVGVFCTMAYYADSSHGTGAIAAGVNALKEKNTILGSYVCNGAISEQLIAQFRKAGTSGPHSASPENEIRWEVMRKHPTQTEMALALERFQERVLICRRYQEQGLEFKSIL